METAAPHRENERENVRRWRLEQLRNAGYTRDDALVLSGDDDVDVHRAAQLLADGCSAELALAILL